MGHVSQLESIASGSESEEVGFRAGELPPGPLVQDHAPFFLPSSPALGSAAPLARAALPAPAAASAPLEAELEAFIRDIHEEVETLRSSCGGLERRMEELMND